MTDQVTQETQQPTQSGLFDSPPGSGQAELFGQTPATTQVEGPKGLTGDPVNANEVKLGDEPKPAVEADPSREVEFQYDPTGNASLDYALDFVGRLGYGPTHPAMIAAQDGNFNLISAELAREGVRGAEQVIALAKEAHAAEVAKHEQSKQEVAKFAYEAAGSEANWKQVQAWASANATPAEKAQVNALLAAGGFSAQSAITFLVQQYSKVATLSRPAPAVTKPNAAVSRGADTGGALSAAAYSQAVNDLMNKNGGRDVSHTAEYAELQARRLQGRRAGI